VETKHPKQKGGDYGKRKKSSMAANDLMFCAGSSVHFAGFTLRQKGEAGLYSAWRIYDGFT
jgi:hypothetical protein